MRRNEKSKKTPRFETDFRRFPCGFLLHGTPEHQSFIRNHEAAPGILLHSRNMIRAICNTLWLAFNLIGQFHASELDNRVAVVRQQGFVN